MPAADRPDPRPSARRCCRWRPRRPLRLPCSSTCGAVGGPVSASVPQFTAISVGRPVSRPTSRLSGRPPRRARARIRGHSLIWPARRYAGPVTGHSARASCHRTAATPDSRPVAPPDSRAATRTLDRPVPRADLASLLRTRAQPTGRPHRGPHPGPAGLPHTRAASRTPLPPQALAYYRLGMRAANLYLRHGRRRTSGGAVGCSCGRSFGGSCADSWCGSAASPSVRSDCVLAPVLAGLLAPFLACRALGPARVRVEGVDASAAGRVADCGTDRRSGSGGRWPVRPGSPPGVSPAAVRVLPASPRSPLGDPRGAAWASSPPGSAGGPAGPAAGSRRRLGVLRLGSIPEVARGSVGPALAVSSRPVRGRGEVDLSGCRGGAAAASVARVGRLIRPRGPGGGGEGRSVVDRTPRLWGLVVV